MTTAQQQQAEQQQDQELAIAAAMVVGTAVSAAAALAPLAGLFAAYGITRRALAGALHVVMSMPPEPLGALGPAQAQVFQINVMRRAAFLVAACRRLQNDLDYARAHGQPLDNVVSLAIARERRYFSQHLQAIYTRSVAAARVDTAAGIYGRLLGWHTLLDARTSAECKAANGKNFYADSMPLIGYPGTVHPHCRCLPGVPFEGARMLPSVQALRRGRIAA